MIKIDEEYIINANESCYTLETTSTIQDINSKNYGKETRTIQGYYTSIEGALKAYLKFKTREYVALVDKKTIYDLMDYIKDLEKQVKEKFKGV